MQYDISMALLTTRRVTHNMAPCRITLIAGVLLCMTVDQSRAVIPVEEENPRFWNEKGNQSLTQALNLQPIVGQAKNLILFLGDGMGIPTVTATRILKGQMAGKTGEETTLTMDTFPFLALSKTYNVDKQMPDSAGTATAYLTGVKANYGTLGLNAAARRGQCNTTFGNEVESVLHRARRAGMSVGIVSTARVQHASPGAAYSHSADRNWYSDADMPVDAVKQGCRDIAFQLVNNTDINVILGGGRIYMFPKATQDPEYNISYGSRLDNTDLVDKWLTGKKNAKYVWNKADFDAVNADDVDYLMGLFEPRDMRYELERNLKTDPSLPEMVEKAIRILRKNSKGFYLFVEDEIDHGHHDGKARQALTEGVQFDLAIAKALELVNIKDTLMVVTADHSHVFSFGGNSARGNPVFGLSSSYGLDNQPFTTALYGNGPGFQIVSGSRPLINESIAGGTDYMQQAAVPLDSETHGSEDVAIFAQGPMAHLFHGVQEQSYIAHVMAYAACLEPYTACPNAGPGALKASLLALLIALLGTVTLS